MGGRVLLPERRQDLVVQALANVHQHVRVRKALQGAHLSALTLLLLLLRGRYDRSERFAAVVLFQDLLVRHGRHTVVVELEPTLFRVRLDEGKVMSAVEIARVYEHAVELVDPWL